MKKRRLTAMLLCLCMTASTITPVLANEESADTEISLLTESPTEEIGGEFGDSLRWDFDADTGLLTISGTGTMPRNWNDAFDAPWYSYASKIKNLVIEEGVSSIGPYAFAESYNTLITAELPSTLTSVHYTSFKGNSLQSFNLENGSNFYTDDGVLFFRKNDEITLLFYPCQKNEDIYTVPEGTTHINSYAFNFVNLDEIYLPDSLQIIYDYAFMGSIIPVINIPAGVQSIDMPCFEDNMIQNFEVDENNSYYTAVDGVLYTKDMQQLIAYPTMNTNETFTIPEGVLAFPEYIITNAHQIKSLYIPSSVQEIVYTASNLMGSSLKNVFVDNDNQYYSDIDGVLFNKNMTELICYPASKEGTEYIIPESTTTILEYAFFDADNLESVIFHENVSSIEGMGFYSCSNMTGAYFYGDVPETFGWGTYPPPFTGVPSTFVIYYLDGVGEWTSPTYRGYNTSTFIPDTSGITTTFDTTEITLEEGAIFNFEGFVSTTAASSLDDIQINIYNAETGIGIKYDRRDDVGTQEFDLSDFPSFTTGTTLTGYNQLGEEQKLELTAGTSWNIQIFATDNDGNSIGANVIKRVNIVEKDIVIDNTALINNTFVQDLNIAGVKNPYITFTDETHGVFQYVGESGSVYKRFVYSVSGNTVTLMHDREDITSDLTFGGIATELAFEITNSGDIKLISYKPEEYEGSEYDIGYTSLNTVFKKEIQPSVSGLSSGYTVTAGETLDLTFTVAAGGNGLIKSITLMNSTTGEKCGESVVDAFEASVTVERTITLSKAGTYNFTVYASADNYTVTDNNVAMFTVTVKEKEVVSGEFEFSEQGKRILMNLEGSIVDSDGMHLLYDDDKNYSRWNRPTIGYGSLITNLDETSSTDYNSLLDEITNGQYTSISEVPCEKGVIKITEEKALELLNRELKSSVAAVNKYMKDYGIPLTQNEFDALVIWFYNLGNTRLANNQNCRLAKVLRDEKGLANQEIDDETVKEAFTTWSLCAGEPLEGLVKRRLVEANIFLYGYKTDSKKPEDYYTDEDLDFYYQVKLEEDTNPQLNPSVYLNIKQNIPDEPLEVVVYDSDGNIINNGDILKGEYTVEISNIPENYRNSVIVQLDNLDSGTYYSIYASQKTNDVFSAKLDTNELQEASYELSAFGYKNATDFKSYGFLCFETENSPQYGYKFNNEWIANDQKIRLTTEEAKKIEFVPEIINVNDLAGKPILHNIGLNKSFCTIQGIYNDYKTLMFGGIQKASHVIMDLAEGIYTVSLSVSTGDIYYVHLIISNKEPAPKIEGNVFQQDDETQEWYNYGYGKGDNWIDKTDNATIASAGCALLSLTNAVYYLNGQFIDPTILADFALKTDNPWNTKEKIRVNYSGTRHSLFETFAKSDESKEFNITVSKHYEKSAEKTEDWWNRLIEHLNKGGTSVVNREGHFFAIVDYRKDDDKFLVYDSCVSTNKDVSIDGTWLSKTELSSSKRNMRCYVLISDKK